MAEMRPDNKHALWVVFQDLNLVVQRLSNRPHLLIYYPLAIIPSFEETTIWRALSDFYVLPKVR